MTVVASLGNAFLYTCLLYLLTGALPTFRKKYGCWISRKQQHRNIHDSELPLHYACEKIYVHQVHQIIVKMFDLLLLGALFTIRYTTP